MIILLLAIATLALLGIVFYANDYVLKTGGAQIVRYDIQRHQLNIYSKMGQVRLSLPRDYCLRLVTEEFREQVWDSASARLSQTVAMDTSESSPKEREKARLSGFQDQKEIERALIILPMRFYNRLVFSNLQIQRF